MAGMAVDSTLALSSEDALRRTIAAMAGPDAAPARTSCGRWPSWSTTGGGCWSCRPPGWGKSAVYWAATTALRAHGGGPTLVVSPLLALMRDQIAAAERAGLRAATINSTNIDEWDPVLADLARGTDRRPADLARSGWPIPGSPAGCPTCWPPAGCW